MGHVSPYDEDVYREWERQSVFASPEPTPEEAREIWLALFEKTYVDGRWTCDPYSAGLVTGSGVSHALRGGKPNEAERLARLFLDFDRSECDSIDWVWHWDILGAAILLQGRESEAVEHWEAYASIEPSEARLHHAQIRNFLLGLLRDSGHDTPCSPVLREYVSLVLSRFQGCKRASARAAQARSNGELADALARTFIGHTTRRLVAE